MGRLLKQKDLHRVAPRPEAPPESAIQRSAGRRDDVKTPVRHYRDLVELPVNKATPLIMHIDLNSCFSTIEQQANPLIRNKPVAVAAYTRDSGIVLAASYEAKALGIKLGTPVRDAKKICPGIIVLMPDPPKYREAHRRFKEILTEYTDDVVPKSIDEFVLDFHGSPAIRAGMGMEAIGREIKQKIYERMGEYVSVNVGIGTNRFLAKLAAGLHKPNGLDVITYENLEAVYQSEPLMALPGINRRFKARLMAAGIATPHEMYQASGKYLRDFVFFSKLGYRWHQRLRGWETDNVEWGTKSIGHQYALENRTTDREEIKRLLMKLCEKTGRRLRRHGYAAYGVNVSLRFVSDGQALAVRNYQDQLTNDPASIVQEGEFRQSRSMEPVAEQVKASRTMRLTKGTYNGWGHYSPNSSYWQHNQKTESALYSTQEIYRAAEAVLAQARFVDKVSLISVHVFNLQACNPEQLGLFDAASERQKALAEAADDINDRFGEFSVVPATMADMGKTILDRIAFGNVRDIGQ